jgi:hypothetical protein
MLNMMVAILGNTYDNVTTRRDRVTLQQQMEVVLKAEDTYLFFTKCIGGVAFKSVYPR